jgi:hypothetical protein
MSRIWSRLTPMLLEIEPLGAGIAGTLLLLIWFFAS